MGSATAADDASGIFEPPEDEPTAPASEAPALDFREIYDRYFDVVWGVLQSFGVAPSNLDDAVQDVFVVVHRRLGDFAGRSSIKTWLYGIALGVARNHRRGTRRKDSPLASLDSTPDEHLRDHGPDPSELLESAQALRQVHRALDAMSDDKREIFVLSDLEELSAPEIARTLGANLNTVYSRIRAARAEFERALAASAKGSVR